MKHPVCSDLQWTSCGDQFIFLYESLSKNNGKIEGAIEGNPNTNEDEELNVNPTYKHDHVELF